MNIRRLGLHDYRAVYAAMQRFTDQRTAASADEIWLVEHRPVFTLGMNGKSEHLLRSSDIAVIRVDRGGQITYHGPGQLVLYCLLDLRRQNLGVRRLVSLLEESLIALLAEYDITAYAKPDAPGVYVENAKIASLGLRVRRGCSYHGLSLNVNMDLTPFEYINPCGYPGLRMIQLRDFGIDEDLDTLGTQLSEHLLHSLGYTCSESFTELPDCPKETEHV